MVNIHRSCGWRTFHQKNAKGLLTVAEGLRITRLIDGGNVAGDRVL
jgi:hypothetical protein